MIMNLGNDSLSPYDRGKSDGLAGKAGPAFPTPDSSWADRLYNRGWEAGVDERLAKQSW